MKKNIRTRVLGTVLAAICAVSAGTAISAVSASAATAGTSVSATQAAKNCTISFTGKTSYGYDWDYRADSTAAKITCTYNFKTGKYTFKAVGQYAGNTNAVLKYATIDGKWHNVPVRFTVDKNKNVTGQQTGKEYITANRYAG
ncbi:MAG: hypothetical protein UH734_08490 [Ruminococcus sp.]|nr:hypothetical protein [Ruminococcus sp.]